MVDPGLGLSYQDKVSKIRRRTRRERPIMLNYVRNKERDVGERHRVAFLCTVVIVVMNLKASEKNFASRKSERLLRLSSKIKPH